jgi:hypothetical protein
MDGELGKSIVQAQWHAMAMSSDDVSFAMTPDLAPVMHDLA